MSSNLSEFDDEFDDVFADTMEPPTVSGQDADDMSLTGWGKTKLKENGPMSTLFQKGGKAGPGRKPGKGKFKRSVAAQLQLMDINLAEELAYFAMGDTESLGLKEGDITPKMRATTLLELLSYTHSKAKQKVEHKGGGEAGGLSISIILPTNEVAKAPIDITPDTPSIPMMDINNEDTLVIDESNIDNVKVEAVKA